MKKFFFIADHFVDEILGGAEICNDILINNLKKYYSVMLKKCDSVTASFIMDEKDCFFIIANFFSLSEDVKNTLIRYKKNEYVIYEHDHKYVTTNNPSIFPDFVVSENLIINKEFFKNAKAVLTQSDIHSQIVQKNLLLDNVINLAGNLWDEEKIKILKDNMNNEKNIEYGILETRNRNKGMLKSIQYCEDNGLKYTLIPFTTYENFIINLSKVKNLVFFPQWLETFSRVSVEAKILGCKIITNRLIGAASEPFFNTSKEKIIEYIVESDERITNIFINLIENRNVKFLDNIKIPKISIITSLYKGMDYIEHFMENITKQTIFDKCELIILDADSPDNEYDIIKKYIDKYDNISYYKFDKRLNVTKTLNKGIEMSSGQFLTIANVDDVKSDDCLEILSKHLLLNKNIDLVYGDLLLTINKNEIFDKYTGTNLYEHSMRTFSKENMIKCLPGPMPMWKRTSTEKIGLFNDKYKYASDWDYWLRCVEEGLIFKKVQKVVGLYYLNPQGLSTSKENENDKFLEEREIFIKYKNIFGYSVFEKYRGYFNV